MRRHTRENGIGLLIDGCVWFAYQVLDELCQKNNWGQPIYQLHSAIGPDQRQLFLYKITIPALATQYPNVYDSLLFGLVLVLVFSQF